MSIQLLGICVGYYVIMIKETLQNLTTYSKIIVI